MATTTMMMMMIMVMTMMMMMVVMMMMMMAERAPSGKYLRCSVVVAVLVLLHFVLASKFITLVNTFAICPF